MAGVAIEIKDNDGFYETALYKLIEGSPQTYETKAAELVLDQLEKYIASHKYAELELEADENIICRAITSRPALETAHLNFVRAKQCQQAAVITLTHRSTNIGLNLAALEALRSGSTIKIAKIDPLTAKILIRNSLESTWCDVWKKDDKNQHAKKFFPVPNDAILLKNIKLSWEIMQILTGHITLNGFNYKIKKTTLRHVHVW